MQIVCHVYFVGINKLVLLNITVVFINKMSSLGALQFFWCPVGWHSGRCGQNLYFFGNVDA